MAERRLSEMIHTYLVNVPDEDAARALAAELAGRGHRMVRVRPAEEPCRFVVESLVDEVAGDRESEWHQAECEASAVGSLARKHLGYHRGGMVAHRETALESFGDEDLAYALDAGEAHALRELHVARFPPPVSAPEPLDPLSVAPVADAYPRLFETLRAVAPAGSWWHASDADGLAGYDDVALTFEIYDSFMHQGTCYPHTAGEVPFLAALAARYDVRPEVRAILVDFLFLAATVGRRLAAADADRRRALGLPQDENAVERAAREAVEAVAPQLLARWDDECEAVCFALALLAAACPEQGRLLAGEIRGWADTEGAESPRGRILGLAAALADGDAELDVLLAGAVADGFAPRPPSPLAPVPGAVFTVLEGWAEKEFSGVLEGP